jgi:hypothetical protein
MCGCGKRKKHKNMTYTVDHRLALEAGALKLEEVIVFTPHLLPPEHDYESVRQALHALVQAIGGPHAVS